MRVPTVHTVALLLATILDMTTAQVPQQNCSDPICADTIDGNACYAEGLDDSIANILMCITKQDANETEVLAGVSWTPNPRTGESPPPPSFFFLPLPPTFLGERTGKRPVLKNFHGRDGTLEWPTRMLGLHN
jgi:hypothetical protein